MFGYPDETLFLMFDILLLMCSGKYLSCVFIAYRNVLNNEVVVFNFLFVDVVFNLLIAVARSEKYT